MSLIYENIVPASYRSAFVQKVREVASRLGVNPNWLMAIIYWESARTFSPSVKNPISGATGLIQFMPSTARALGTTVEALAKMTAVEQMDWVYKYFTTPKRKLTQYTDLYFTVFYPAAIGKPDTWVLQSSKVSAALIAKQNPAFDLNKDKQITVGEVKKVMLSKLPTNWLSEFEKKKQ